MKRTKCEHCNESMNQSHSNQKYHKECADFLRSKPVGFLNEKQEEVVRNLAGTMFVKDLAKKINSSIANLKRWNRDRGIDLNHLKYKDHVIKEVTSYYELHGRRKTQKKFPHVKVRSIVERYKGFKPRQIPWKGEQLLELVKFAGLVTPSKQARFFNRPFANKGSIKSAWTKKFKTRQSFLHGMPKYKARYFVKDSCPITRTEWRWGNGGGEIYLWCDIKRHLKRDCPDFIKEAVEAMNEFQVSLYGDDPRAEVINILEAFKGPTNRTMNYE